jgi:hypothetical protein
MIVKYIGAYGKVLRAFTDVSSMWQHDGNSIVTINRNTVHLDKDPNPEVASFRSYSYEFPIALINLAPGESLEREDEPARG